jgi:hypothetical protein
MYSFRSVFNTISHYTGFGTQEEAEANARQWARANYTTVEVLDSEGSLLARISDTGTVRRYA